MNSREVERYSNHTTLSKDDPQYWNFSFDEIGRYDVAAGVDHVLNATGAERLTLVGLSQGVTSILVLLSTRPEYNDKVDLVVAYGPVANLSHVKPPLSVVIPIAPLLPALYPVSRAGYLGASEGLSVLFAQLCKILTGEVCSLAATITLVSSPYQLNETRVPMYLGHFPIGTTIQNLLHFYQCELIRYFDYPCEISYVTTDDGYVLEVDRVPRGRQGNATAAEEQNGASRHPVLFVPVFTSASDIWFINFPSQSPGFLFADAGFDVWSMNSREAERYSNHTTLSKNDPEYWKFSFDEMGRYDVAAGVDHVLNATGAEKLTIVAFSQGVTTTLVLLSTRPEYNDKVDLVVAYGPVANLSYITPPFSLVVPFAPLLTALYPVSRAGYLGASEGLSVLFAQLCKILTGEVCSLAATITHASSPYQLNETRVPMYLGHFPIGSTIQNVLHFYQAAAPLSSEVTSISRTQDGVTDTALLQVYKAKEFVMYDHGPMENVERYNQATPPSYPLERITTPWALFSSDGDQGADPRDVKGLVARLGSRVILHRVVPQKDFGHADFAIGYRSNDFLHNVAIDVVKQQIGQSE
ncbi:gastric triacylglycerol lipase-like [Dermacentor albipictus]|uniref:gastric triacylglycerol lipase-like n=1 Tax=Dermacentor albipictus TaxID=60249 RepID=UPI0038FC2557